MPAANTYVIDEMAQILFCSVEDTYGTEKTLVATDVLATMGLEGKIFEGESDEIRYDGDGGTDIPEVYRNSHNGFDFELYGAASGSKGVAPHIGKILRVCGANEFITENTDVRYRAADISEVDSGTFAMYEKVDSAKWLRYLTTGARGQIGFSFQDGGKSKFKVSNLLGAYHEPTVFSQALANDFGTQKTRIAKNVDFENTAHLTFDGHQLCVQSLEVSNLFGVEVKRVNLPGCRSTIVKRVQPTINLTFRMPDWEEAFHPYAKANTDNGVNRAPFSLQIGHTGDDDGKILRLLGAGNNETQFTRPTRTTLSDGTRGMQTTLRCLTGLELIFQ